MTDKINFLTITDQDFPLWQQMREVLYPSLDDEYHLQEMRQMLESDDWFSFFLTLEDKTPIGLVEISSRNIADGCLSSPVAYLEGLYLSPEQRSQGIGKQVLLKLQRWCKQQGFTELATDAELDNTRAQQFYLQNGFEETYRVVEFRIAIA